MKKVYDWFGGRRYFIALLIFAMANFWLYLKYITEDAFVTLMSWVIGLYIGGNVLQKIFEGKNGKHE